MPNPAYWRIVHGRPVYIDGYTPRVNGNSPGTPSRDAGSKPSRSAAAYVGRIGKPDSDSRPADSLATQAMLVAVKLVLDLHEIYNRGGEIDRALRGIIDEAIAKKAKLVEIIPGKGSGQLKKRVLRFLDQKEIKALYHRVEKDSDNFGRVFVHFRWK